MHASQRKKHYSTTVTTPRGKSPVVPHLALTYAQLTHRLTVSHLVHQQRKPREKAIKDSTIQNVQRGRSFAVPCVL
jgi:hypothetical protein